MGGRTLAARPLTRKAFAPFGDVIQSDGTEHFQVNAGAMDRFHSLAQVDIGSQPDARAMISLFRSREAISLPYEVTLMECHPLGSQAFVPLRGQRFVVVVAPPGKQLDPAELRAFLTDGTQGVNYHRGVWHMPLSAFEKDQEFLVVDRGGSGNNYEEFCLEDQVTIVGEPRDELAKTP